MVFAHLSCWSDARGMLWYGMLWSLERLRLKISAARPDEVENCAQQTGEG